MTEKDFEDQRQDFEKQIYDLKQLLEISKSLNSTLDYNILIDSILFTIMAQMKVLRAGLFAKKGLDTPFFSLHRNYKGFELSPSVDYSLNEEHPVIKLFQKRYDCYSLGSIEDALGSLDGLDAISSLQPSLIVPLKAKGVVNGIIVLAEQFEGRDFEPTERDYVLTIATLAAIAINNAFLFEMTTTDMMTKLKLKHYFYTVLIEKMEQAANEGRALSLVMTDIDHFKRFNDTYGHLCGDLVLKQVARVIQGIIRSCDLAARYGGEEFCVLLPDTDANHAFTIAERIRTAMEAMKVEYEGKALGVTISLGVAQYDPSRDVSTKALVDRADKALYYSKQNGRNRTSLS
jgi:diguanylate cyclase (GGDEF)-like protein